MCRNPAATRTAGRAPRSLEQRDSAAHVELAHAGEACSARNSIRLPGSATRRASGSRPGPTRKRCRTAATRVARAAAGSLVVEQRSERGNPGRGRRVPGSDGAEALLLDGSELVPRVVAMGSPPTGSRGGACGRRSASRGCRNALTRRCPTPQATRPAARRHPFLVEHDSRAVHAELASEATACSAMVVSATGCSAAAGRGRQVGRPSASATARARRGSR